MRVLSRLVVVVVVLVGSALWASPAQASTQNYSLTKTWDKGVPGCIGVKLHGRIDATDDFYVSGAGHFVYRKSNPRLINPKAQVNVRTKCGGANKKATKVTIRQYWHYSSCSANPSLSVGVPWSASVSVTPTCGKKKVGYRQTTAGKGHTYTQNVSGKVAQWKKSVDWASGVPPLKLCVRGAVDVTVYFGTNSYSKTIDMGKACV